MSNKLVITTWVDVEGLGFTKERDANKALKSMCQQIGVNYLHSQEYLSKHPDGIH
ncbi:MAG: hypothetical protein GXP63_06015 [DPANN group archaeon]|nr:hypothetical protein [DPANN group archaeon]